MEKADAHAALAPGLGERRLRTVQPPLARENAAVLVAVAVADHHLLHRLRGAPDCALILQAASRHRVFEKLPQDRRAALEILDRFEKRYDRKRADQSGRRVENQ